MLVCVLCLDVENSTCRKLIDVYSQEDELDVCATISKHFWLNPNNGLCVGKKLCWNCWEALRDFHQFYMRVADVHKHIESKSDFLPLSPMDVEVDSLPTENIWKSEELDIASELPKEFCDNFVDSEVKVEVGELEMLPQIEVLDNNLSERLLRVNRRSRAATELSPLKVSKSKKRSKHKNTKVNKIEGDSSPELPLSVLLKECDFNMEYSQNTEAQEKSLVEGDEQSTVVRTKKRRGRPKKIQKPVVEPVHCTESALPCLETNEENMCIEESDGDVEHNLDDRPASKSDSDSDDVLPDVEPNYSYAEIPPQRIPVRPKKYRKRPKPAVPPRRMTREEIDQKNARRVEFDKVIAKFFENLACPKCSLLVQDFGHLKLHFRASHNDQNGYIMCCGKRFVERKALAEHIYVHWNPDHFKCATCSSVLHNSRSLEVHEKTHTDTVEPKRKTMFQCDKCEASFTTKVAKECHLFLKHVPESEFQFTCPECNKKLPTKRKFTEHIRYMHDPENTIICDKCGKMVRQSYLKKHHEIEHSEFPRPRMAPVQCQLCGGWLRHSSYLKRHMKTVHDDSGIEHRCNICGKSSKNAIALRRHVYVNHKCAGKFKCTMCDKSFKRLQDIREHTSTHTGEVLYTCPHCPMTFFSNANMHKHRQRLHRAEWEAARKKPKLPYPGQQPHSNNTSAVEA